VGDAVPPGTTKTPERERHAPAWTASQRRALLLVLSAFAVVLAARLAFNPTYVSNPQPERPPRYHDLADRIDPNTADWQTLAALPALGEKRAKAITEYRDERLRARPGETVFNAPRDLMAVHGIGVGMVVTLRPYLVFPTDRPATTRGAG
jgi:DNA uptake protein ComE-like DNA-binding protein